MEATFAAIEQTAGRVELVRAASNLADQDDVASWATWSGRYAETLEALRTVDGCARGAWCVDAVRACPKCKKPHYPAAPKSFEGGLPADAAARCRELLAGSRPAERPCKGCGGAPPARSDQIVERVAESEEGAGTVFLSADDATRFDAGFAAGVAFARGAPIVVELKRPCPAPLLAAAAAAAHRVDADAAKRGAGTADPAAYRKRLFAAVSRAGPPAPAPAPAPGPNSSPAPAPGPTTGPAPAPAPATAQQQQPQPPSPKRAKAA